MALKEQEQITLQHQTQLKANRQFINDVVTPLQDRSSNLSDVQTASGRFLGNLEPQITELESALEEQNNNFKELKKLMSSLQTSKKNPDVWFSTSKDFDRQLETLIGKRDKQKVKEKLEKIDNALELPTLWEYDRKKLEEKNSELADAVRDLEKIMDKRIKLEDKLNKAQSKITGLEVALDDEQDISKELHERLGEITESYDDTQHKLDEAQQQIENEQDRSRDLEEQLENERDTTQELRITIQELREQLAQRTETRGHTQHEPEAGSSSRVQVSSDQQVRSVTQEDVDHRRGNFSPIKVATGNGDYYGQSEFFGKLSGADQTLNKYYFYNRTRKRLLECTQQQIDNAGITDDQLRNANSFNISWKRGVEAEIKEHVIQQQTQSRSSSR